MLLLIVKFETDFQNFVLALCHREKPRPGRSLDLDQDALRLAKYNPHLSTRELSLDTFLSTICCHLKRYEKGVSVPHTLGEKIKEDRIFIEPSILSRQK